ncbi:putative cell wall protein [Camellia sinensis]|uniref:putative cell wall protein n=1 Tax=Camellia sinensis TaxID=4442 RepID=UPI0010357269|nr:putative cell wall protein [Camellia sinensis]
MASNPKTLLPSLLILSLLLLSIAGGMQWPDVKSLRIHSQNTDDMKKPESFIDSDGSVLIPGIGRFMLPRLGTGFNPFTYNPVTGTSGGTGIGGGIGDDSGSATHEYVPSGDDTLVPNPGVEVPNPGNVGSNPAAAQP